MWTPSHYYVLILEPHSIIMFRYMNPTPNDSVIARNVCYFVLVKCLIFSNFGDLDSNVSMLSKLPIFIPHKVTTLFTYPGMLRLSLIKAHRLVICSWYMLAFLVLTFAVSSHSLQFVFFCCCFCSSNGLGRHHLEVAMDARHSITDLVSTRVT